MYTIDELKERVSEAAEAYNEEVPSDIRIERITLFGSYASERANDNSDVDLLVAFRSSIVSLITLAKVLSAMEEALNVSVDLVQDPLPEDSLLVIERKVSLYERG